MSRPSTEEICRNPLLYYLNESVVWTSDQLESTIKHPTSPPLNLIGSSALPSFFNKWIFGNKNETKLLQSIFMNRYGWEILLSPTGSHLLLLKDNAIELRTSSNGSNKRDKQFENLLMQLKIEADPHPNWRKLIWSDNGRYFGCASSSGCITIFDINGALVGSFESPLPESGSCHPITDCYIDSSATDSSEFTLIVVHITGFIRVIQAFYRSHNRPLNQRQLCCLDMTEFISGPIISATYSAKVGILVIGTVKPKDPPNSVSQSFKNGILYFRRLNEQPYIKATMMTEEDIQMNSKGRYKFSNVFNLSNKHVKGRMNGISKLKLSPDLRHLVSLSAIGCIKFWSFPSGQFLSSIPPDKLPYKESSNPMLEEHLRFGRSMPRILPGTPSPQLVNIEWWGNEDLVIARQDGCVSLLSISDKSSRMGDVPEWFEPFSQISHGLEDVFFVFECESRRKRKHSDDVDNSEDFSLSEEKDDDGYSNSFTYYMWNNTVYYMRRMFSVRQDEPLRKKMRLAELNYKLICFKSTTPEELYDRKIIDEEYGEALRLALKYGLDTDIVYQKQWQKSKMTQAAIEDYLTKISKRNWVLHECLERVPEDVDSMRSLLEFGLQASDVDALHAAGQNDSGQLVLTTTSRWLSAVSNLAGGVYLNSSEEKELMSQCEQKYKMDVLDSVDLSKLNIIQKDLLKTRRHLLALIDKLDAFELILGGRHRAPERYKDDEFQKFRQSSPLSSAVKYAKEGNYDAVSIMFSNFSSVLNEHRLAVLWNIPETEDPQHYNDLLPELGDRLEDLEVIPLVNASLRETDWCEQAQVSQYYEFTDEMDEEFVKRMYREEPMCAEFRVNGLTRSILADWFALRAQEIDRSSRQTDKSLTLVSIGIERGLDGLQNLYHDLSQLHMLIYDCRIGTSLTLEQFLVMPDIEKIQLMMSNTSEEMFIKHLWNWLFPFVESVEKKMNSNHAGRNLLRDYLLQISKTSLKFIHEIMKQRASGSLNHSWLKNGEFIARLCIDIVSQSEICDEYAVAEAILKLIPRGFRGGDAECAELDSRHEDLNHALKTLKILSLYGIHRSFHFVNKIKDDPDAVQRLMNEVICKEFKISNKQLQKDAVCKMVADLQASVSKFFRSIHPKVLLKITFERLLLSSDESKILLAREFMEVSPHIQPLSSSKQAIESANRLSFNEACEIILIASRDYFDNAVNSQDEAIEFARRCLNLIEAKHPLIEEELRFISALEFLETAGLSVLPAVLRNNKNRGLLLKKALDIKENLYQKFDSVLTAAVNLKVKTLKEESQGEALRYIVLAALKRSDLKTAMIGARSLVNRCYAIGWQECLAVAKHRKCYKSESRLELCRFAVTHCPPDELPHCLAFCHRAQAELLAVQNFPEQFSAEKKSGDLIKQGRDALFSVLQSSTKTLRLVGTSLVGSDMSQINASKKNSSNDLILDYFFNPSDNWMEHVQKSASSNRLMDLLFIVGVTSLPDHKDLTGPELTEKDDPFESFINGLSDLKQPLYQQLFQETWRKDSLLALLFALCVDQVSALESVLKEMPSSEFNLFFATVLFALRILKEVEWIPDAKTKTLSTDHLIQTAEIRGKDDPRLAEELAALVRYKTSYDDYSQAKRLQAISSSVDLARFTKDPAYKEETILGLCMTDDQDQFRFALTLVDRYQIDKWEANMTFYEYLLMDSELPVKELRQLITKVAILDNLRQEEKRFYCRMRELYELLDGTQYSKLLFFFSSYNETESEEITSIKISVHKKVVNKLKSAVPQLNYKLFISPPSSKSRIDVVRPHLSASNVHVIAKMLLLISTSSGGEEASGVYGEWAKFVFWHGERQSSSPNQIPALEFSTTQEWMKQFDLSLDYINRLLPRDVVDFVENTVFGAGSEKVTNDGRIEILRRILKILRSKSDSAAIQRVEELREHLEFVLNCALPKLSMISSEDSGPLQDLMLTAQTQLPGLNYYRDLFAGMLMCEVSNTREVIQFAEALKQRESVILGFRKALHQTATDYSNTAVNSSWQLFQRLVEEAAEFHDTKSIVEALCELLQTSAIRKQMGPQIIHLIQSKVDDSSEVVRLVTAQADQLLKLKIDNTVNLCDHDITAVFEDKAQSPEALTSAAEALLILELVQSNEQSRENWSTWLSIMKNHGEALKETVSKLIQDESMSMEFAESCCHVFKEEEPNLAFSVAVLCGAASVSQNNKEELQKVDSEARWKETLQLILPLLQSPNFQPESVLPAAVTVIVRKKLVSSFASSPLYDYLIEQLLNAENSDLASTAADLHVAGYSHQAAHLLAESEALHPGFRTFDVFNKMFKSKFC